MKRRSPQAHPHGYTEMLRTHRPHSVFQVVHKDPEFIFIIDCYEDNPEAPMMTVTNDAEAVCKVLYAEHGNKRFVYRDTSGRWDELVHEAGVFKTYKPLPPCFSPNFLN